MRHSFHGYNLLPRTLSLQCSLLKLLSEDSDSMNPPPVISSRRFGTFLTEIWMILRVSSMLLSTYSTKKRRSLIYSPLGTDSRSRYFASPYICVVVDLTARSQQRQQFPDLVPQEVGSGYAGIASGRVLNVKHATATRSSSQSSRQVWDRVAQAAGSSSSRIGSAPTPTPRPPDSFPVLAGPQPQPAFRQQQRNTPWASGSGSSSTGSRAPKSIPTPAVQQRAVAKKGPPPPSLTSAAFPVLPSSGNSRMKPLVSGNQSLRKILGETAPTVAAWQGNDTANGGGSPVPDEQGVVEETASGKGKKGKGKQKQTLFTLGSFPT